MALQDIYKALNKADQEKFRSDVRERFGNGRTLSKAQFYKLIKNPNQLNFDRLKFISDYLDKPFSELI